MSSSRNKRKRAEVDAAAAAMVPTPVVSSRRRAREPGTGAEPTDEKNEGGLGDNLDQTINASSVNNSNSINIGESSASGSSDNVKAPQHATLTPADSNTASSGGGPQITSAGETSQETKDEKKREADSIVRNKTGSNISMKPVNTAVRNDQPQAQSSAPRSALHASADSNPPPQKPESKKAKKIRSAVSHRKLLLDRVRSGRSAARNRILQLSRNESQKQSSSIASAASVAGLGKTSKGNTAPSSKSALLAEKAKDDAEMEAFKKLSRAALQAAKKQRAENNDGGHDKRPSVSLRRGASVGKKMNAALSSLVPGAGVGASVPSTETPAAQPLHVATAAAGYNTASISTGVQIATAAPPRTTPATYSRQQSAGLPTKKMKASNQAQASSQPIIKGVTGDSIPKAARSGAQKNIKNSVASSTAAVVRGMSTIMAQPPSTTLPLHAGLAAPGLPNNRLASQPVVSCPEALALRERRNVVRSKLMAQLEKRRKRLDRGEKRGSDPFAPLGTNQAQTATTTPPTGANDTYSASSSFISGSLRGLDSASYLPRRRKTHWDNVLTEMKWMATDFVEERKWKISAARTISSAAQESGAKIVRAKIEELSSSSPNTDSIISAPNTANRETKQASIAPNDIQRSEEAKSTGSSCSYIAPTIDDDASSKKVARIISSMALELGNATLQAGALSKSDRVHVKALKRHRMFRKGVEMQTASSGGNAETSTKEELVNMESISKSSGYEPEENVASNDDDSKGKVGSFSRISKAVEALTDNSNLNARKTSKRKAGSGGKVDGDDLSLTSWQVETIDFIEKKWGKNYGPGAVVSGPRASGKTIALCSLLWKGRSKGAQLVVCSSFRVMNWVHELKRFQNLRVRTYGFTGGISSPFCDAGIIATFIPNEVVVCEFSFVRRIKPSEFDQFETLVLDCRFPCGFLGSRWPSIADRRTTENPADNAKVPSELICESWWENLVESASKRAWNKAIIEYPGQEAFFATLVDKSEMQRVELVALRAAFILGAHIFASSSSTVKKRMLTWARRKTKAMVESPTNKIKEVQRFLIDLVRPFYCDAVDDGQLERISHTSGKRLDPEIRPCCLSAEERSEYEKCCWALRGALSFSISKTPESSEVRRQTLVSISDALLRLRKQCVHTKLSSLLASKSVGERLRCYFDASDLSYVASSGNRILSRKVNDSPSQADSELASRILDGSAKLRELVSILRNECDYTVEGEDALKSLLQPEKSRRAKSGNDRRLKTPKKVVILAVLPEVQIIISVLLNCIGIAHDLLLHRSRFFNPSHSDFTLSLPEKQANASTLAWIECQQALSRFNSIPTSNLIITSPDIVAGDHGGIGIDMADFVITVDEDWSGRDELIMRSLVAGLIPRNLRAKDKGCQLLRLVCENTCEENFLSVGAGIDGTSRSSQAKEQSDSNMWPWPVDCYGRFSLEERTLDKPENKFSWPQREENDEIFSFPANNLLRFRNQNLAEVLAIGRGLPPFVDDGSQILFLPQNKEKPDGHLHDETAELALVKTMMEAEEHAHIRCSEAGVRTSSPSSFHCNTMTRQDLSAIAIRVYMEHFWKTLAFTHMPSCSGQLVPGASAFFAAATHPTVSALEEGSSELADVLQSSGLSINPTDFASSLLFYSPNSNGLPQNESEAMQAEHGTKKETKTTPGGTTACRAIAQNSSSIRVNKYVDVFNCFVGSNLRDGRQGSESLVYFPPLFPRLLECSIQAQSDINAFRANRVSRQDPNIMSTTTMNAKRPGDAIEDPSPKRLKAGGAALPRVSSFVPPVAAGAAQTALPVITEDESSHSDTATVLLDLDEDFGLVGVGALALPKDSAFFSSNECVEVSNISLDPDRLVLQNEWLDQSVPCDIEELESLRMAFPDSLSVGSVLLFVRRKNNRQFSPLPGGVPLYRPPAGVPAMEAPWASAPGPGVPGNGVFHDMNGSTTSAKKSKKKAPAPVGSSAFVGIPGLEVPAVHPKTPVPVIVQMVKAKDMYRNRLLSFMSPLQKAMGMTLFETPSFCIAAVRFRNRADELAPEQNWASNSVQKIGPGVPLMLAKDAAGLPQYGENDATLWTSIVKRLKTKESQTGDDARALAEAQRSALRRSLSAPCRVDFGPFHSGFLPSLSGMTGITPPRSRIGVSLPMGVKIPSPAPLREQQRFAWNENDDRLLRDCTARYGMNWILAARVVSGLDDIVIASSDGHSGTENTGVASADGLRHQRSARSCRDRWQALARVDPSLAKEVRQSDRVVRESASTNEAELYEAADNGARYDAPVLLESIHDVAQNKGKIGGSFVSLLFSPPSTRRLEAEITPAVDTSAEDVDGSSKMEIDQLTTAVDASVINADTMDVDSVSKSQPWKRSKKAFRSLLGAKTKQQVMPLTIPGVAAGSQPSFVTSHPSHAQSVQTSIAATWTNGRTEMWPLQFLDVADKQRAASAAASAAALAPAPALSPSPSTSSAARPVSSGARPPSGVPKSANTTRAPVAGSSQPYRPPTSTIKVPPHQPPSATTYHHSHPPPPHRHHPHVVASAHVPPAMSPHHPHPHHHPHQHHQRMAPSPSNRTVRAHPAPVPQPQYGAHTPVVHSQQLASVNPRAQAPPGAARPSGTVSNRSPPSTTAAPANSSTSSKSTKPAPQTPPKTT